MPTPPAKTKQKPRADFSNDVMTPFQIGSLMLQVGFPVAQLPTGIAIALAESGGRRAASHTNSDGSIDRGLWQINSVHASEFPGYWGQWSNAVANTAMAKGVYDKAGGWSPWVTYSSGSYTRYALKANNGAKKAVNGPSMESGLVEVTPGGVVADVASGIPNPISSLSDFFTWITNPYLWLRVAALIGGTLLVALGAVMLFKEAQIGEAAGIIADKFPGLAKVATE